MSNQAVMKPVKVLTGDALTAQKEVEELEARLKLLKQKTKGMSITLFKYVDEKTNEQRCGVSIRGLGMRPHNFFAEQVLRIVDNTPEAEANRQAVRDFIEANRAELSWKK